MTIRGRKVPVTGTFVYSKLDLGVQAIFFCGRIPRSQELYTAYVIAGNGLNDLNTMRNAYKKVQSIDSSINTFKKFYQGSDCVYPTQELDVEN
jgi:hypothetical protein